jgi:hypothetical protein
MDFDLRMKNLRLTPKKEMIAIMSDEYSEVLHRAANSILEKMWQATVEFQENLPKKKMKKKLKFWQALSLILSIPESVETL